MTYTCILVYYIVTLLPLFHFVQTQVSIAEGLFPTVLCLWAVHGQSETGNAIWSFIDPPPLNSFPNPRTSNSAPCCFTPYSQHRSGTGCSACHPKRAHCSHNFAYSPTYTKQTGYIYPQIWNPGCRYRPAHPPHRPLAPLHRRREDINRRALLPISQLLRELHFCGKVLRFANYEIEFSSCLRNYLGDPINLKLLCLNKANRMNQLFLIRRV